MVRRRRGRPQHTVANAPPTTSPRNHTSRAKVELVWRAASSRSSVTASSEATRGVHGATVSGSTVSLPNACVTVSRTKMDVSILTLSVWTGRSRISSLTSRCHLSTRTRPFSKTLNHNNNNLKFSQVPRIHNLNSSPQSNRINNDNIIIWHRHNHPNHHHIHKPPAKTPGNHPAPSTRRTRPRRWPRLPWDPCTRSPNSRR